MKILLTKEQEQLLSTGNIITIKDGSKFLNLPSWFKLDENNQYHILPFEELPVEVKDFIITNPQFNKQ